MGMRELINAVESLKLIYGNFSSTLVYITRVGKKVKGRVQFQVHPSGDRLAL